MKTLIELYLESNPPTTGSDFSKVGVEDGAVPGTVGVGSDGGRSDLVAEDQVEGGGAVGNRTCGGNGLAAGGVILLLCTLRVDDLYAGGWEDSTYWRGQKVGGLPQPTYLSIETSFRVSRCAS
jgi:hypothetical protein